MLPWLRALAATVTGALAVMFPEPPGVDRFPLPVRRGRNARTEVVLAAIPPVRWNVSVRSVSVPPDAV